MPSERAGVTASGTHRCFSLPRNHRSATVLVRSAKHVEVTCLRYPCAALHPAKRGYFLASLLTVGRRASGVAAMDFKHILLAFLSFLSGVSNLEYGRLPYLSHLDELLIGLLSCSARSYPEFTFQDGNAALIGPHNGSPIATRSIQAHEVAIGCLLQRVMAQQPLRGTNRPWIIAFSLQQPQQPFQHAEEELVQPVALRHDPLVIALGKQIALIDLGRLF